LLCFFFNIKLSSFPSTTQFSLLCASCKSKLQIQHLSILIKPTRHLRSSFFFWTHNKTET
jgi:hypothetical protein